jgi:hypothetical protein
MALATFLKVIPNPSDGIYKLLLLLLSFSAGRRGCRLSQKGGLRDSK